MSPTQFSLFFITNRFTLTFLIFIFVASYLIV
uniref:Uncharacterized protein n=1 Tax=Arundo donax TaxID=35708 RepID=A0A0A8ZQ32_ARUDO